MFSAYKTKYLGYHLGEIEEIVTLLIATVDRHEISADDYTVLLDGLDLRKRLQEIQDGVVAAIALL